MRDACLRALVTTMAVVALACSPRDADLRTGTWAATDDGGFDADFDADFDGPGSDGGPISDDGGSIDGPGSDGGGFDGGGFVDGPGSDAGADAPTDSSGGEGGVDAPGLPDAGADAGIFDAGADAGIPDAGVDGGVPDGGVPGAALVDIVPAAIDLGEVRVGAADPSASVTITNRQTSTAPAQLASVALRLGTPALALTPPATPVSLVPGASAQATVTLDTAADLDLAGEHIDIVVDGATRAVPVSGRVVTASSQVVPEELDLGSACIGTQASGNVTLINTGTATLTVDAPQIEPVFVVTTSGAPGTLAPAQSATATLSAATITDVGVLSGTLLWHDDVPTDHAVPVLLEYIASGTAVSPKGLDFGTVAVDALYMTGIVKFQNCDLTPNVFEIQALRSKQGTLAAWQISPPVGTRRQLSHHDSQQITITFDPTGRGRYEAELLVRAGDEVKVIQLLGDSTGRDFGKTSFYACMCTGGGSVVFAWPILAAIALTLRRRRRN